MFFLCALCVLERSGREKKISLTEPTELTENKQHN